MYIKTYFFITGAIFLITSLLGFSHIAGTETSAGIFGRYWELDNVQSVVHVFAGAACIGIAILASAQWQKIIAWLISALGIFVTIYSLFDAQLFGAHFEQGDTLFYMILATLGMIIIAAQTIVQLRREMIELQNNIAQVKGRYQAN